MKRSEALLPHLLAALLIAAGPAMLYGQSRDSADTASGPPVTAPGMPIAVTAGGTQLRFDSSAIEARLPDASAIAEARASEEFIYEQQKPKEGLTWLGRVIAWIFKQIGRIVSNDITGRYIPLLLFAAALVYAIWKIGAGKYSAPLAAAADPFLEPDLVEENIHEMDFDQEIRNAVAAGRYRRAVRLCYLRLLKQLADRGAINWRIDKTNREYVDELGPGPLGAPFEAATRTFEYVWYGDFEVDAASFEQIHGTFVQVGRLAEGGR